ncbi:MAG: type II and III secretion system protein family protein [Thermodesulfobacteriota bacterium]
MNRQSNHGPVWKMILILLFLLVSLHEGWAAQDISQVTLESHLPQKLTLTVGKSTIITSPAPVKRVSLAAPEIADAIVLSPQQIYVLGKAVGTTNLTLWKADDSAFTVLDLEVSPDLTRLKEKLKEILPGEDIRVMATHDSITLSGLVSSTTNLSQALAIAESYAPKKVINLLQAGGTHQVMLEVRIAEMSRTLTRRLGFNFAYTRGGDFGVSLLNNLTSIVRSDEGALSTPGAPFGTDVSSSINALFRFHKGSATWTGFIDALKENGLVKILAEPTLISLSGQEASFLAGGEFPIPVPQETNVVTINYKTYGVGLTFTPTVLSDGKISMRVAPEVSDLDYTNAVYIYGYLVPGLTTRRASTVIELANGQSFAIAGLLKDNVRQVISKFPVLGDIPILGALFRSSAFQKNETELIIIVTPHLVKPLDLASQPLPTDQHIEPDDFEFYLLGTMEGKGAVPDKEGGLEGEFGHIIP